ncbi:MAG TPA: lactate utilization protein [Bryobacteraceae bacterium]|nr:lactate utilization protein [Bryobacteraceae bacterium]
MPSLFETFRARAEAVSAEVHRVESVSAARAFILSFLIAEGVADQPRAYAVCEGGSLLGDTHHRALALAVPGLRFDVTRETAEAAKVGISQVEWGIAATGTLVTDATAVERRLVSALPSIHIAILPTAAIQPDMAAVFTQAGPRRSAYLSMITGPSRTADIERVLTIGVHGPARVVIVCVDNMGSN